MKALVFERSIPRYAFASVTSRLIGSGRGTRYGPLRLCETKPPDLPGSGWRRLSPILAGICGSDLATLDGRSSWYFENFVSLPFVPGHEIVGTLHDDRQGAGDRRVVVESVLGCATRNFEPQCPKCRRGLRELCEHTAFGDLGPGLQTGYCASTGGGWSTSLVVHESQCHDVPQYMSDEAAVMVEPAACAVHAALAGKLDGSELAIVSGAGTLGLCTLAAIKRLAPETRVLVGAKHKHQRELASDLGADLVVSPEHLSGAARRLSGSLSVGRHLTRGADIVFDCVGSATTLESALETVCPRGRIVLVGMPGTVKVDLAPLWHREVKLLGAYAYGTESIAREHTSPGRATEKSSTFDLAFDLVTSASLERLVSATYPLERHEDAIAHAGSAGSRGAVKIAFDMRSGMRSRAKKQREASRDGAASKATTNPQTKDEGDLHP